jgi:hypothetical protein
MDEQETPQKEQLEDGMKAATGTRKEPRSPGISRRKRKTVKTPRRSRPRGGSRH